LLFFTLPGIAGPTNYSANISELYQYLHFDPAAPNCAVMVQVSDIHMDLRLTDLEYTTNIDPRLVTMVNALRPQPAVLAISGDTASNLGGPSPGYDPNVHLGTNELKLGWSELGKLTNRGALYIIPGNHDSPFTNYINRYFTETLGPDTPISLLPGYPW
jgi:predicted MPP superfamily phosphohydrolase